MLQYLADLWAFGFVFWFVFAVLSAIEIIMIENRQSAGGLVPPILFAFFVAWWLGFRVDIYVWNFPWDAGVLVAKYIGIGFCWWTFMWIRLSRKASRSFNEFATEFCISWNRRSVDEKKPLLKSLDHHLSQNLAEIDMKLLDEQVKEGKLGDQPYTSVVYAAYCNENRGRSDFEVVPLWRNHINEITIWILFWPWSAFWWLMNRFIVELVQTISRIFRYVIQTIGALAFGRGGRELLRLQRNGD